MSVIGAPIKFKRQGCDQCLGKFNTGYHKIECFNCLDGKNNIIETYFKTKLDGTPLEPDTFADAVFQTFARHFRKFIPNMFPIKGPLRAKISAMFKNKDKVEEDVQNLITGILGGTFDKEARLLTRAHNIDVEYLSCGQEIPSGINVMRLIDDISDISDSRKINYIHIVELDPDLDYIMLDQANKACMLLRKPDKASLYRRLVQNGHLTLKHQMIDHMRNDMRAMREDQKHEWEEIMNGVEEQALTLGLRL